MGPIIMGPIIMGRSSQVMLPLHHTLEQRTSMMTVFSGSDSSICRWKSAGARCTPPTTPDPSRGAGIRPPVEMLHEGVPWEAGNVYELICERGNGREG
jgi:hypothetical protein